jgi:CDP-diacylglycerol--serine O-phosphatidyltransferase
LKVENNNSEVPRLLNLPNILTGFNLLSGFISIVFTIAGRLDLAVLAILGGMLFDFLDGMTARLLKVQSALGKQLDSLADVVTFGVAPGFFMLVMMSVDVENYMASPHPEYIYFDFTEYLSLLLSGEINDFVPFIAMSIPFFSMLRLAKFNVDERQSDSFIGLPTPANTLLLLGFPALMVFPQLVPSYLSGLYSILLNQYFMAAVVLAFSVLLIVELPLFALKFKNLNWRGNEIRYIFLLISIGLIPLFGAVALTFIVILDILYSVVTHFLKRNEI